MNPFEPRLICGDVREVLRGLPAASVHCCVTSPPYWGLRDYKVVAQLGLEATPEEYVATMVDVFREVRRVLRTEGTLWLNLGDSYASSPKGNLNGQDKSGLTSTSTQEESPVGIDKRATGLKSKDLVGIPWRVALALQADGWWLRSDIIWSKPNPMPESVTDRPTRSHEYIFLLLVRPHRRVEQGLGEFARLGARNRDIEGGDFLDLPLMRLHVGPDRELADYPDHEGVRLLPDERDRDVGHQNGPLLFRRKGFIPTALNCAAIFSSCTFACLRIMSFV